MGNGTGESRLALVFHRERARIALLTAPTSPDYRPGKGIPPRWGFQPSTASLGCALVEVTDRHGIARVSAGELAARCSMALRNVQQHVTKLRVGGFLAAGSPGRSVYTWRRDGVLADAWAVDELAGRRAAAAAGGVPCDEQGRPLDPRVDAAATWSAVLAAYHRARDRRWPGSHGAPIDEPATGGRRALCALALDLAAELRPWMDTARGCEAVMHAALYEWMRTHQGLDSERHPLSRAAHHVDLVKLREYARERCGSRIVIEEEDARASIAPGERLTPEQLAFSPDPTAALRHAARRAGGQ